MFKRAFVFGSLAAVGVLWLSVASVVAVLWPSTSWKDSRGVIEAVFNLALTFFVALNILAFLWRSAGFVVTLVAVPWPLTSSEDLCGREISSSGVVSFSLSLVRYFCLFL